MLLDHKELTPKICDFCEQVLQGMNAPKVGKNNLQCKVGGQEEGHQPKTFREKGLDRFWRRKATVKFSTTDDFHLRLAIARSTAVGK